MYRACTEARITPHTLYSRSPPWTQRDPVTSSTISEPASRQALSITANILHSDCTSSLISKHSLDSGRILWNIHPIIVSCCLHFSVWRLVYTHPLKRCCFLKKKTQRRQSFYQQTWVILSNRSHYLLNARLQVGWSIFHANTNQVTRPAFTHTHIHTNKPGDLASSHTHTNKPGDLASSHTHARQVTWPVFTHTHTHTNKPGDLASFHTHTHKQAW